MKNYNFLPLWYRKKVRRNKKLKLRMVIYILLIMILGSGINTLMNFKNVRNLDKELQFYSEREKIENKDNKTPKQEVSINSLKKITPYIKDKSNLNLSNITIENKRVFIKGHNSTEKSAKEFIQKIEKDNKFKIKDLSYVKEKDKINLEVCLEG
ncbi:hypothetical protein RBU49_03810 [Clostridium sp. MB40-C1]|uniref:hypothetical protein n=1 Tax=Clostridium sp. MB40-C1 TaxID=3070996 RepID=UPI0027DEEE62|nr:hypothetical protein [Clostridium sp. MB40-C1]WMJ81394.1 hypothetical protein RBU49_03810 [Clostridium sp. MB40-C1]